MLAALLFSAVAATTAPAAQPVEIYNVSLRFHRSTPTPPSGSWSLDFTSGPSTAPANGELALADGTNPFTHAGFIFLTNPLVEPGAYYPVSLNIPTVDQDGNGIFDILEQQAVTAAQTAGYYTDGAQIHTVQATWNKPPGAHVGSCELEFPDLGLTFTSAFENIHYSGTYDFTKKGLSLAGQVAVQRQGVQTSTLSGPLNLQVVDANSLAWGRGQWRTETGAIIDFEGSDLDRSGALEYSAFYVAADGYLVTSSPDYQTWLLVLPSIPDANGNGTPDLIEGGSPLTDPTLALTWVGDTLTLRVSGGQGQSFDLETSPSLSVPPVWTTIGAFYFPTDFESVPLAVGQNANAFYRLKR